MGNCRYCGKPAGLLRSEHAECEQKHQQRERLALAGRQRITAAVLRTIANSGSFDELEQTIAEIERTSFVPSADRRDLLITGWESAVDHFLEDGLLNSAEEARLAEFQQRFALQQDELNRNGAVTKTVKAAVLREVLSGSVPERMSFEGHLPINLQKDERIVWAFRECRYLEDKTRRTYAGKSQGVSIRVMSGVYYRLGGFKGHATEHTERTHVDTGLVVITNKGLYFAGPRKSLRLPYSKIVSFEPFSDGIGVTRDAVTAKPQMFVTGDGWYTYNLVTNLARH